jgi:hypothetical protein
VNQTLVRRGRRTAPAALILLAAVLGACGSGGAPASSPTSPTAPASGAPAPSASAAPASAAPGSPAAAVDIDTLLASGAANDGTVVTVKGFFITDGTSHQFCSIVLESYPPQCGGTAIVINGAIPPAALALLQTPDDANLAKLAWGVSSCAARTMPPRRAESRLSTSRRCG